MPRESPSTALARARSARRNRSSAGPDASRSHAYSSKRASPCSSSVILTRCHPRSWARALRREAAEAECDRGVGDGADLTVALEEERLGQALGDADDGLGEHLRVAVGDATLDDPVLDVAD